MVRIELDKIKANALQTIDNILQLERNLIYTQNTEFLASEKQRWSSIYTLIQQNSSKCLINTDASEPESDDDQDKLVEIIDDRFQQALSVMVNVMAYFQVAYKVKILK